MNNISVNLDKLMKYVKIIERENQIIVVPAYDWINKNIGEGLTTSSPCEVLYGFLTSNSGKFYFQSNGQITN